jgi:predicted dehydrogenase
MLELAAICTAHEATARAAAERHNVPKWYEGVEALAADADIDLVTVAVRPRFHLPLAAAVMESGKMVYCEWPLARTTEEAEQMAALARQAGVANAVGLQGRFAPAIQTMRQIIRGGRIGDPLTFEASLLQSPFTVDSDRAWLSQAREASGALHVATAHVTDAVQHVLGELGRLTALTDTVIPEGRFGDTGEAFTWNAPDTVVYVAESKSGISGAVSVSNATLPPLGFRFRVAGDEGQVVARASEYFQFSPIEISLGAADGTFERIQAHAAADSRDDRYPSANVARALEAFVRSLDSEAPFSPDFEDGLALHRVIDAIAESAQTFQWKSVGDETATGESLVGE